MELVGGIKRPLGRGKVSGVAGRDDGGVGRAGSGKVARVVGVEVGVRRG